MDEVTRGTFLRAKQEVTVAVDLLNWLAGHGISLPARHHSLQRLNHGDMHWMQETYSFQPQRIKSR